ncbi:FAD/NAD(P)-binding protein [Chromobacterium amazonense]|uniref:FAD/NAD(P)-binding protein n=1 Tax=Chromobacterium amazonense TaxID=1382803 RepID=UPI003F78BB0B
MNSVIALIGSGSTALSFIHHYLQQLEAGAALPRTMYLFEKRAAFGSGAAYEADRASNLLNTKTEFITPFIDQPGDFWHWLQTQPALWRHQFPGYTPEADGYAPRPLFGMYLEDRLKALVKRAASLGLNVVQLHAEVLDIQQHGNRQVLNTDCNLRLVADYVFLTCGTLPARRNNALAEHPHVLNTPYPVSTLPARIPAEAAVGILGARLSAIDAVIALIEQGHRGPITLHSRSGYFPSVRGTQGRIQPRYLSDEYLATLRASKGKLSLQELIALVQKEIMELEGTELRGDFHLPAPPASLENYLQDEIHAAAGPRAWQAALYATNPIIDQLWAALHEEDKQKFLDNYFSAFMAYRVSIPVENARKILRYLQSGQLRFCSGSFGRPQAMDGGLVLRMDGEQIVHHYDYLIQAMGSPRQVGHLESELLSRLLQRGVLQPHPLGGVKIEAHSYCAEGANGQTNPRFRVLGELTTGAFFFTSALDINARHAKRCVEQFATVFTPAAKDIEAAQA